MERYSAAFASLTEHLVYQYDAVVTFLSTCQGVADYHDDSRLASAIAATLPDDVRCRVTVDSTFHTPSELMEYLREFDWVVATRMHLAIMALGVGVPVLPIAYEFKSIELFRGLGYERDILTMDTLTPKSLIEGFEFAVESYGRIAQKTRDAVDQCRRDAWQVTEILREEFPEFAAPAPCAAANIETDASISEDHARVRSSGL
jgi:colanic acid/amylovoran biosynthesis protein